MDESEDAVIERLEKFVTSEALAPVLSETVGRAGALATGSREVATVAVERWCDRVPPTLLPVARCCRISAYPSNTRGKVERHPNSYQRVRCLRGAGVIDVFEEDGTTVDVSLPSRAAGSLHERWSSVAPDVWHRPRAGDGLWVVLALHTSSAEDLIDEYS